ncbi:hypothetical protein HYH03_003746 [Edaphochlamys debaryana]|uniref:Uncharacterized protein n=1 Tax=Edaphochlamys debaryana TaxID=47281 RepID=A0A835Y8Z6_9CHLO|nr:hypothetical protein HYH03_003746 [Edaphochlamys debaryana]|eukprot:KAG2498495.1 hypothetical protein HYH03_003746 [Edaphochlamys debaryana]
MPSLAELETLRYRALQEASPAAPPGTRLRRRRRRRAEEDSDAPAAPTPEDPLAEAEPSRTEATDGHKTSFAASLAPSKRAGASVTGPTAGASTGAAFTVTEREEREELEEQERSGRSALSRVVPPPAPLGRPSLPRGAGTAAPARASPFARPQQYKQGPMQLTLAIKAVKDWRQLPRLLSDLCGSGSASAPGAGPCLDPFNAAALLTHAAQRVTASPPQSAADVALLQKLQDTALEVVGSSMHEYRARQVSNMTWALARLGLPSGSAFIRDVLLPASYPLLPWYEPQHVANTLWALATAGVAPDDAWLEEALTAGYVLLQRRALAPQHLANTLWALERLGVMPDEDWMAAWYDCAAAAAPRAIATDCSCMLRSLALMAMHTRRPEATARLATQLAARLADRLAACTPAAGARSRATSSGPGVGSAGTMTGAMAEAGREGEVTDQSIANGLWAMAVMKFTEGAAVEALWGASTAALRLRMSDPTRPAPGVETAALTVVLWAAAVVSRPLPAGVMTCVYGRVRAAQLDATEPRNLATMVWALSAAHPDQARPPADWLSDVVAATGRRVNELGPQAVSSLLHGLCTLGARPPPGWMSGLVNHFHRDAAAEASNQSVANVLWCLARMGYRLNPEGMEILVGIVASRLAAWQAQAQAASGSGPAAPPFTSQEVSNLMYALATLGYAPRPGGELAQGLLAAAAARLPEANAQELSNMAWSLAVLQLRPSDAWQEAFAAAAAARLPSFAARDLAQCLYGAAKLRLPFRTAPPGSATAAWLSAALAAAPRLLGSSSGQDLCNVSWALVQMGVPVAPDSPLALAFARRLETLAGGAEPSQLALGVWALGKWRVRLTGPQLQALEVATFRKVPLMRPHELAAMLSGFAGMRHTPPSDWLEDAVQQIAARSREFGPQDWTVVLHALARVQDEAIGPQAEDLALRLLPRLPRLPLPAVVLIAYSAGCMGPGTVARQLVSRCLALLAAGPAATAAEAAEPSAVSGGRRRGRKAAAQEVPSPAAEAVERLVAKAVAAAGPVPEVGGDAAAAAARPVCVASLTAVELSALMWAAVRVGLKTLPAEFRNQFFSHTLPMLPELPASLVASYAWAAGRLRLWLPGPWRSALAARALQTVPEMRGREVAMALQGLLWLRVWPSEELLQALSSAYTGQAADVEEKLRPTITRALELLARRVAVVHRQPLLLRPRWRAAWARKAREGAVRRAALAAPGGAAKAAKGAAEAVEGKVTRRAAIRLGVLRRRPSRAAAAAPQAS